MTLGISRSIQTLCVAGCVLVSTTLACSMPSERPTLDEGTGPVFYPLPDEELWRPLLSQPDYEIKRQFNVMVPMRDGVHLSSDIYLPDAPGPFPTMLMRRPYDNNAGSNVPWGTVEWGVYYAKRGYAVVLQDTRGRYDSEGEFNAWHDDPADGYDTLEWIGQQPWCNEKIGMFGSSYSGLVQWLAAPEGSQYLKAIAPWVAPSDFYQSPNYTQGAFQLGLSAGWGMGMTTRTAQDISVFDWERLYRHLPIIDLMASVGYENRFYTEWLSHPDYDDYWKEVSNPEHFQRMDVPAFSFDGWFDLYANAPFVNFNGMRENALSPEARRSQKLIQGPWTHALTRSLTTKVGSIDFGPKAMVDLRSLELRWFDYWLKGIENGIMDEPPIMLFIMGENVWRFENEWPLSRTQYVNYYLRSDGQANSVSGDGVLSLEGPPGDEKSDTFVYDPEDPVPTLGGQICCWPGPEGPHDQRSVEQREDVLVFSTPVLEQDIEITGPIVAKIYAASTAVDTDFTAKLVDVFPDGYAVNLTDGIVKATHRESLENPSPIIPGEIYEYTIDLWATANMFKKGHQIRLEVSSSNFPRFARNPNTGEPIATAVQLIPATQTIYHDATYSSHIVLPVIPR